MFSDSQYICQCCEKGVLTDEDYSRVAEELNVEKCVLVAIARKETGAQGAFDSRCRPTVLFERHIFRRETGGRYNESHPHLSGPYGNHGRYSEQWPKLNEAISLDESAGIKSASWGLYP